MTTCTVSVRSVAEMRKADRKSCTVAWAVNPVWREHDSTISFSKCKGPIQREGWIPDKQAAPKGAFFERPEFGQRDGLTSTTMSRPVSRLAQGDSKA